MLILPQPLFCNPLVDSCVLAAGVVVRLYDAMHDDPKWLAQFAELKPDQQSFVVPSELPALLRTAHKSKLLTADEHDRLKKLFALPKVTTDSSSLHSLIEPSIFFCLLYNIVRADRKLHVHSLNTKVQTHPFTDRFNSACPHLHTPAASTCCIGHHAAIPPMCVCTANQYVCTAN